MTIQKSLSNPRLSSSHDEHPTLPHRGSFLSPKGSDYGSVSSRTLGSDHFAVDVDLCDDDSWSVYEEDDLAAAEAKFEQKFGLSDEEEDSSMEGSIGSSGDEDDEEQSFSHLYGHMSTGSASLSDDDITLDAINEGEVIDFGTMKEPQEDAVDYGYGDAVPASKTQAVDYGYGDAAPDSDRQQAVDYGYGDAAPDSHRHQPAARPKVVRRSSMKQLNGSSHSRASICFGDEIEVQLQGQQKTVKKRRSINFLEEVEVNHVEKVTEMDGKKEELWFQKMEFKNIAIGAYRDANKAMKGCRSTDIRGLENIIQEDRMDKRVDKAIDLVMDAQDIQYDSGKFDATQISDLYTLSAVDSKIDARLRARRDAREAEEYLRETRRAMRRMSM
ncbi:MAG: hypothetical protein SGBAC_005846 [Bacillariaceae sp.]